MINLSKFSGLPISLADNGAIEFNGPLAQKTPASRTLGEMRPLLSEQENSRDDKEIIYDVYRNANLEKDEAPLRKENVRYDFTVIHPRLIGKELPKTFGHYHEGGYPEVFEVIFGKAFYLLQSYEKNPKNIQKAILVEASENEKAIMLPNFGHISINRESGQELVISNFVSNAFNYDYENYRRLRGACYYILTKNGPLQFKKNENYKEVPELIRARPKEIPELGIVWSRPLYSLVENPEYLSFLSSPDKFLDLLTFENCYQKI